MNADGHRVSFWEDENVLELDSDDTYTYNAVNLLKITELYTLR